MEVFFGSIENIKRIIVVGVLCYISLILILRLSGKRTLSNMNVFDFIITVAIGSTFSTVMMDSSISLLEGIVALGLLVLLQYAITFTSVRSKMVGKIIKSEPALLYYNGEFIEENMVKERVIKSELDQTIRKSGYSNYENISAVILETDGAFSVITSEGDLIHTLDSSSDLPFDR